MERYIINAAVLPDFRQPAPREATPSSHIGPVNGSQPVDEPLLIHGHSMEDYRRMYQSVVDPMLKMRYGQPRSYHLQMGRVIKQRLWEEPNCPTLLETEDAGGRLWISESYCSPTLKCFAPLIEVDISEEPMPVRPKRKRRAWR